MTTYTDPLKDINLSNKVASEFCAGNLILEDCLFIQCTQRPQSGLNPGLERYCKSNENEEMQKGRPLISKTVVKT